MHSKEEFHAHIRRHESLCNAGVTTIYRDDEDRTVWIIAGRIFGYSAGKVGECRGYDATDGDYTLVIDDGEYRAVHCATGASIRKVDGWSFYVPHGHSRFPRILQANTSELASALYAECAELHKS